MTKTKKQKPFDPTDLSPEEKLKFEIAEELGLRDKVISGGWRSLTAKEKRPDWRINYEKTKRAEKEPGRLKKLEAVVLT